MWNPWIISVFENKQRKVLNQIIKFESTYACGWIKDENMCRKSLKEKKGDFQKPSENVKQKAIHISSQRRNYMSRKHEKLEQTNPASEFEKELEKGKKSEIIDWTFIQFRINSFSPSLFRP